jgi:2-oxoisovalerate dehydrogenase E2 component (dihydrolipoyl transacylase)
MDEGGPLAVTIELPQVGESVVEGTIGKWLKQPGDTIRRFEPLVEVITDKVTMEVPSPVGGSLLKILAQEGETIPMGAPIAEVETSDTTAATSPLLEPIRESGEPGDAGAKNPAGTTGYLRHDIGPAGPTGGGMSDPASLDAETGAGAQAKAPAGSSTRSFNGETSARPLRHSPAVRRLAEEHNIDLSQVSGTGMGGRITRDDVLRSVELGDPTASPTARPQPAQTPAPGTSAAATAASDEEHIPLTPVRRMIAEAMVRSVTEIPHAWSTMEVDVSGLVALRDQVKAEFLEREGMDLTYLPFIIKAVVESLKEYPTLNASWGGDKIILKKRVNIGIAVAAPSGLIVPVIHDADRLSVAGLAGASRGLVRRARENKLTLEDVQGGTFTLNNTGALGSNISQPIINYPQAAIMTTEAIQKRTVVRDDAIAIRSMMNLCMSFDHRINDGAESGGFMLAVKTRLEVIGPGTPIY